MHTRLNVLAFYGFPQGLSLETIVLITQFLKEIGGRIDLMCYISIHDSYFHLFFFCFKTYIFIWFDGVECSICSIWWYFFSVLCSFCCWSVFIFCVLFCVLYFLFFFGTIRRSLVLIVIIYRMCHELPGIGDDQKTTLAGDDQEERTISEP